MIERQAGKKGSWDQDEPSEVYLKTNVATRAWSAICRCIVCRGCLNVVGSPHLHTTLVSAHRLAHAPIQRIEDMERDVRSPMHARLLRLLVHRQVRAPGGVKLPGLPMGTILGAVDTKLYAADFLRVRVEVGGIAIYQQRESELSTWVK